MAWMFLCTFCATGTPVENDKESKAESGPQSPSEAKDNDGGTGGDADAVVHEQRPFLSCDLCAQKLTESYYCPHCLAAYPAHYVKLRTRCTRCVSCPVCTSPLEKIVYSGVSRSGQSAIGTEDGGKKKDVYMYQCPFCFWSSNIVGLEAAEGDALLENLKEKIKRPVEEKTLLMREIKGKYEELNEALRREEERIEKAKRFHNYKGGKSLLSNNAAAAPSRRSAKESSAAAGGGDVDFVAAIAAQKEEQFRRHHLVPTEKATNVEPPLSTRFVSQFHLRNVSPLQHRLSAPLQQSVEMEKYTPSKFHLMTKESYKCPNRKCGKYVCKPTLRGRQANYDKRTAVLDYLPRVALEVVAGSLMTTEESTVAVMLQNRHLQTARVTFDPTVNEEDLYSTATIECSREPFDIDTADIHIKGGQQREEKRANGDYVKGKEVGIMVTVRPKHYSTGPRRVQFCIKCTVATQLQLKEDRGAASPSSKKEKHGDAAHALQHTELPFVLDFDLGPPKTADEDAADAAAAEDTDGKGAANEDTGGKI